MSNFAEQQAAAAYAELAFVEALHRRLDEAGVARERVTLVHDEVTVTGSDVRELVKASRAVTEAWRDVTGRRRPR